MIELNLNKVINIITRSAWALFFFTLPVTSFPFFPSGIGGKTLVRPLAIYPLTILLITITLPRLFKRPLPKTFLPLFAFMVVALISSVVALAADLDILRGVSMASRLLRNMVTLIIGLAFYLTTTLLHESLENLKFSLRWMYAGFAVALAWGTLQTLYVIHFSSQYFKLLNKLQSLVATRKLFQTRISGMTYEPKWFAEQIFFLLLPWLMGAVLSKQSAFKWRYKWITLEWILLIWASIVLVFTYSRTGLVALVVLVSLSFLIWRNWGRKRSIIQQENNETPKDGKLRPVKSRRRLVFEAMLVASGIITILVLLGAQNPYFSRFWRYFTDTKRRNRTYLEFIAVQSRFVYVETALNMFNAHPFLGVGLGNYAFYFDDMLPNEPWFKQPEIIRQITPTEGREGLITPKNLLARLLAETGFFGTATFASFVLAICGCVAYLWLSRAPGEKYWGISGFLSMVMFIFVVFSSDSFAQPNTWIVFGLITAATHINKPQPEQPVSQSNTNV